MNMPSIRNRIARVGAIAAAVVMPLAVSVTPVAAEGQENAEQRYVLPFEVLQGRPDVGAGDELGYWLWHDDEGLHLRTTTQGLQHNFNGVIRAAGDGRFFDVDRIRLDHSGENQDRVGVGPGHQTIVFHFDTWSGADGIDFRLAGQTFCVELLNNGHEATDVTHLGRDELRPDQLPVCFQR
ncbi:MAG: hypothetical protein ACRDI2_06775 [Chloroflexota bacterium]